MRAATTRPNVLSRIRSKDTLSHITSRIHEPTSTSSTMNIFGEPLFPLFLHLPIEIQMQIWRYATTPDGLILRPISLPLYEMSWQLSNPLIQRQVFSFYNRSFSLYCNSSRVLRTQYYIAIARFRLMSTCRLARLIALEAWRKDVEAMWMWLEVGEVRNGMMLENDWMERKYEFQYRIVQNLVDLIK